MGNPISNAEVKLLERTGNYSTELIDHNLPFLPGYGTYGTGTKVFYKNNLWMFPKWSHAVIDDSIINTNFNSTLKLNIATNEITSYAINKNIPINSTYGAISAVIENLVFLPPDTHPYLDIFDLDQEDIIHRIEHGINGQYLCSVYDGIRYVWYIPYGGNVFIKLDTLNYSFTKVNSINSQRYVNAILDQEQNCLWCIPFGSTSNGYVLKIDVITNEMTSIDVSSYTNANSENFFKAFLIDNYVYITPIGSSYVIRINRTTNQVEGFDTGKGNVGCILGCVDSNNNIWLSPFGNREVVKFDTTSLQFTSYQHGQDSGYYDCEFDGYDSIWFSPRFSYPIIRMDINTEEMHLVPYDNIPSSSDYPDVPMLGHVIKDPAENYIIMLPGTVSIINVIKSGPKICKINLLEEVKSGVTNSNGVYEFDNVKTYEHYDIIAGKKDLNGTISEINVFTSDNDLLDQDFILTKTNKKIISGEITDGSSPVSGVSVNLESDGIFNILNIPHTVHSDFMGFGNGIFHQNNLWLINKLATPEIVRLNTVTNEITKFKVQDYPGESSNPITYPYAYGISDGKYIWLCPDGNNTTIDKLDPETGNIIKRIPHGQGSIAWTAGCYDGNRYIWMAPFYSGGFFKIDTWNNILQNIPYDDASGGAYFYNCIFDSENNCIWATPLNADNVVRIDNNTNDITTIPYAKTDGSWQQYWKSYIIGDYVYMIPSDADNIIKINRTTNALTQISHGGGLQGYLGGCVDSYNNIWLACYNSNTIKRIRTSDGDAIDSFSIVQDQEGWDSLTSSIKFMDCESIGDYIYFCPHYNDSRSNPCAFIRIHVKNFRIEQVHMSYSPLLQNVGGFGQIIKDPKNDCLWSFSGHTFTEDPDTHNTWVTGNFITRVEPKEIIQSVVTSSDGLYSFDNCSIEKSYKLIAGKKDNSSYPTNIDIPSLQSDSTGNDFIINQIPQFFSIRGTISGDAIEGVNISLSGNNISIYTVSDINGNYSFTLLDPGEYLITPSLNDYIFTPSNAIVTIIDSDIIQDFQNVFTGIMIYGNIIDSQTGLPAAGVRVEYESTAFNNPGYVLTNSSGNYKIKIDNPSGTSAIVRPFPRDNTEQVWKSPDYGWSWSWGFDPSKDTNFYTLSVNDSSYNLDFKLFPYYKLSGTIVDYITGLPCEGVEIHYGGGYLFKNEGIAVTDSNGHYEVDNILRIVQAWGGIADGYIKPFPRNNNEQVYKDSNGWAWQYTEDSTNGICYWNGLAINLSNLDNPSGIDLSYNFIIYPYYKLSGTIIDYVTGLPCEGVEIQYGGGFVFKDGGGSVLTDSNGNYEVDNVIRLTQSYGGSVNGWLRILPRNSEEQIYKAYDSWDWQWVWDNSLYLFYWNGITLNQTMADPGQTADKIYDGIIYPFYNVKGIITDYITGNPVSGITIDYSTPSLNNYYFFKNGPGSIITESDGSFSIPYRFSDIWAGNSINAELQPVPDSLHSYNPYRYDYVQISSGGVLFKSDVSGYNFSRLTEHSYITGTVLDGVTGTPVSGMTIEYSGSTFPDGSGSVITDTDGKYSILYNITGSITSLRPIPRNSSEQVWYNSSNAIPSNWSYGRVENPLYQDINISSANLTLDFKTYPFFTVSGTITDHLTGLPCSGVSIQYYNNNGGYLFKDGGGTVTTDSNGYYHIDNVLRIEPDGDASGTLAPIPRNSGEQIWANPIKWSWNYDGNFPPYYSQIYCANPPVDLEFDFNIHPYYSLSGTILNDITSLPVPGVSVVYSGFIFKNGGGTVITDSNGYYHIDNVLRIQPDGYHSGSVVPTTTPIHSSFSSSYSNTSSTQVYDTGDVSINFSETNASPSIKLQVVTTAINQTFTIPISSGGSSYSHNFTVNWGDGNSSTVTSYNSSEASHTYSSIGTYELEIIGTCQYMSFLNATSTTRSLVKKILEVNGDNGFKVLNFYGCPNLDSVVSLGTKSSLTDASYLFSYCTSLVSLPDNLLKFCTAITTLYASFQGATSLSSLPVDLFRYSTSISDFSYIFQACSALTSVSSDLFRYNTSATNFTNSFGSSGLTSIPSGIFRYNTNVTNFTSVFSGCTSITSLPSDLFRYNTSATNFTNSFYGCTSLSSISTGSNIFGLPSSAPTLYRTFQGCTSLSTIPVDLFNNITNITTFNQTFYNCTSLSSIPEDLFEYNTSVSIFSGTFQGCNSLTSIPVGLFQYNTSATSFYNTFNGCTNLSTIPSDLFKYNTSVTTFEGTFGSCYNSLTSLPDGLFQYNLSVTNFNSTFQGCYKLDSVPENLFGSNTSIQSFYYTFYGCKLSSIPENLFKYTTNVRSFLYTFGDSFSVNSLTSIPSGLFKYNSLVTSFEGVFYGCTQLTTIPSDLFKYNTSVTSFIYSFQGCIALTTIPSNLFDYNTDAQDFSGTFKNCTALTAIPSNLFDYNTNVTKFGDSSNNGTFYGCTSITSVPTDLFKNNTNVLQFNGILYGCTLLETVPSDLFKYNTSCVSFNSAFRNCSKLQINSTIFYEDGEQSTRFLNKSVNFSYCFYRTSFTGTQGTVPDLWNCSFGTGTPVKSSCFAGSGNSSTSISNYSSIDSTWK